MGRVPKTSPAPSTASGDQDHGDMGPLSSTLSVPFLGGCGQAGQTRAMGRVSSVPTHTEWPPGCQASGAAPGENPGPRQAMQSR